MMMATQFARLPSSVAALPFLLARPQKDDFEWTCKVALKAAIAAEQADDVRRTLRGRVAYLICEYAFQLARRRVNPSVPLALGRCDIAEALEVGLNRVKRTLALLTLSGIIEVGDEGMRVLDWSKLCACAAYVPSRLDLEEEEEVLSSGSEEEAQPQLLTKAGDPACFV
jgi:hypothetical protein